MINLAQENNKRSERLKLGHEFNSPYQLNRHPNQSEGAPDSVLFRFIRFIFSVPYLGY